MKNNNITIQITTTQSFRDSRIALELKINERILARTCE